MSMSMSYTLLNKKFSEDPRSASGSG